MKKEFIVERSGKNFVLYAGLLDEAHSQGLRAINTTLVQVPNDENGRVAIVQAMVETEKGAFSGLGDAAPDNVARPMVTCLIRMAETRAKARALRDAVNVGVVALEELGADEDTLELNEPQRSRVVAAQRPVTFVEKATPERPVSDDHRATTAQVRAIYAIARNQHGLGEPQTDERCQGLYGCAPSELSKRQASDFITSLQTADQASR
ncbi:MAG: hypothetical protein ACYC3S_04985 [Chloroflexota bacterium]